MYYNNQTFEYGLEITKEFFSKSTNFISSNYYVKYITQYINYSTFEYGLEITKEFFSKSTNFIRSNYSTFDHELISFLCLFVVLPMILFYTFKTIFKTKCTQKYPTKSPNKCVEYMSLQKRNYLLIQENQNLTSKNQFLTQEYIFFEKIICDIINILEQNEQCPRKQTKINNLLRKHFDY